MEAGDPPAAAGRGEGARGLPVPPLTSRQCIQDHRQVIRLGFGEKPDPTDVDAEYREVVLETDGHRVEHCSISSHGDEDIGRGQITTAHMITAEKIHRR